MSQNKKQIKSNNSIKQKNSKEKIMTNQISDLKWKKATLTLCCVIIFILLFFNLSFRLKFNKKEKCEPIKIIEEKIKLVGDNYVFLGDSITNWYPLDEYYENLPVINSGVGGYTTDNILSNLKSMVYDYNPSKIFLLIGTNDFMYEKKAEEVANNIEKIIDQIKENRPYAKIYVESILPINETMRYKDGRDNKTIVETNNLIQKICTEKSISYIDIYSKLIDEEKRLNKKYTDDGLHLNSLGYVKMTNQIMPYLMED